MFKTDKLLVQILDKVHLYLTLNSLEQKECFLLGK